VPARALGPARATPAAADPRAFFAAAFAAADDASGAAGGWVEHDLVLAGARVRVRFAGPELVPVLLPPLAHAVVPPEDEPDATVAVWDGASTRVPLPPLPWEHENVDARARVAGMPDGLAAYHNVHFGGVTLFDLARREGLVWAESAGRVPWYERGSPLRTALHLALPGRDRHLVHAGAVGGPEAGVLVGGRSGSGKSSLCLASLAAGLGYAGDDYVVLTLAGGPAAHCLYATGKVDPAGLARLPGLEEFVDRDASIAEKAVLDLGGSPLLRPRLPVRALVLPRVSGAARPALRELGPGEALRDLGPSTVIQMPYRSDELLAALGRLVREVPSYRLELGGADLRPAVELVRGLLAA
jgi:hypothetical protein